MHCVSLEFWYHDYQLFETPAKHLPTEHEGKCTKEFQYQSLSVQTAIRILSHFICFPEKEQKFHEILICLGSVVYNWQRTK